MELKLIYENTSNGSSPISIAFGLCIGVVSPPPTNHRPSQPRPPSSRRKAYGHIPTP